ncbi:serine protease [Actinocrispum sp. NPDC049592]|uniref:serine protease n=1 Tax=Actinocrispum sp. NPDC049592 TaxID=3154835 RepID=UPI003433EEFD
MRIRARIKTLCAATLLLLAPAAPAAADPSSPEELAAAVARPAIVYITVNWHGWVRDTKSGEVFGGAAGYDVKISCTGVVINPDGYVATASHCVHTGPRGGSGYMFDAALGELAKSGRVGDPAKAKQLMTDRAVAEGTGPDRPVDRTITVERMVPDGKRDAAPATVVDLVAPEDGDVAVLKIPRNRLPSLDLRMDDAPVGTPVLAIGYPGSTADPKLEPSNKNGQISAHRTLQEKPFYEFSAAATHGMSGGPLVDMQGRVTGLISQGAPGETQSFNFATASSTVATLLSGKGIEAKQGPHDHNYRTGLDRYFAGDYNAAVNYFDATVAGSPTHIQAAEYLRQAHDKGGKPSGSTAPLLYVGLGCALIAVIAIALVVLMIRRRRRLLSVMDTPPYGFPMPIVDAPTQPS